MLLFIFFLGFILCLGFRLVTDACGWVSGRIVVKAGDLSCRALDSAVIMRLSCRFLTLGHELMMLKVVVKLVGIHSLVCKQVLGNGTQLIGMLGEYLLAQGRGLVEYALYLLIDKGGGLLGLALGRAEVTSDEDAVVGAVIQDRS